MKDQHFTTTLLLDQSPTEVFNAIINPRAWWSEEIEGGTSALNDVFTYHYEDIHFCKVKLIELVPDKKVVWHILENDFNFIQDKTEWTNTKVNFEISTQGNKTQLVFTHIGLVPEYECYEVCREGWSHYIQNSLDSLIRTGKGQPNATGTPRTKTEEKLAASNK
jgi:uncharacterized protein YndB with AHSA1/START domain